MAELFGRDKSVISKHLKSIYDDGELNREATVAKYATVQIEGEREVNRQIEYHNLEAIFLWFPRSSVGTHTVLSVGLVCIPTRSMGTRNHSRPFCRCRENGRIRAQVATKK